MSDTRNRVITQLQGLGWSREQALGIAANLHQESTFNPAAVGDGGKAYGIAQWHPDRQENFRAFKGKDIRASSLEEQVEFVDFELRKGAEQAAGKRLLGATKAGEAAGIVSQFYERPADKVGEATRRGRTAAMWAGEDIPAVAPPTASPAQAVGASGDGWFRLPSPTPRAVQKSAQTADTGLLGALEAGLSGPASDPAAGRAETEAAAVAAQQQAALRTGFGDVFTAQRHDPRTQAMFTLLDKINAGPAEVPPAGWSYADQQDQIESGMNDDERAYLRENVTGPESLTKALGQLGYRRDLDREVYGRAGGAANFWGAMAGGIMDPVGFAAGVGVTKAFQMGRIGSGALIAAGRPAAAVTSAVGEAALGNVAVEALQDAAGEVKGTSDYAMAAAFGAVMTTPFLRGTHAAASGRAVELESIRLQQDAAARQAEGLGRIREETGITDSHELAREYERREQRELDETQTSAGTRGPDDDQVIPRDVQETQRQEHSGEPAVAEPPEPAKVPEGETAPEPPPPVKEAPPPAPSAVGTPDFDLRPGGEGGIVLADRGHKPVILNWALRTDSLAPGRGYTVKETLEALLDGKFPELPPAVRQLANYLHQAISDQVGDVQIKFGKQVRATGGVFDPRTREVHVASSLEQAAKLEAHLERLDPRHLEAVVHEIVHAATHSKIEAFKQGTLTSGPAHDAALELEFLRQQYSDAVDAKYPQLVGKTNAEIKALIKEGKLSSAAYFEKYGQNDLHEFATMTMASPEARALMQRLPGRPVAGRPSSMWHSFVGSVKKLLGLKDGTFWDNATAGVDALISAPGGPIQYRTGGVALMSPALYNGAAQRAHATSIAQHARGWLARNPIDPAKLATLNGFTKKWGGLSDGLVLAQSQNPIMRMIAGLVTEVTTGAAGRKQTAAIRKELIHRRIMGNAMIDYESHFDQWNKTNGGTLMDSVLHGNQKRAFNRQVHEEILKRRNPNYQSQPGPVGRAADAMEAMFERSRKEQVGAGTLGSDGLPASSRGYVPQALDGAKLQNLSVQELAELHDELSMQFQARLGWDKAFADTFAPYYTDRIRRRSQGTKEVDSIGGGGNDMQVIRDTLDEMTRDPALRDRAAAASSTSGLKQTKARLDLDLMRPIGNTGKKLLDLYVDDPLTLGRMYASRTAGDVALTETGILGIKGIRELRDAAGTNTGDPIPTKQEFEAYDRVMSEIMGTPVAGQVTSAGATNLRLLVGLQRLGGLVFAQAAESWNMIHHVGLRSTLGGQLSLGRHFGEVNRLKKGAPSGNSILTSMEVYGGEFGMEHYKMVAPLDPPDAQVEQYLKQTGIIGRLLRGGVHLQSKVSFFRGLLSAQHRMVAEQITMRALRFINEGKSDKFLADMGFTPDVVTAIRAELPQIARWDGAGNLTELDLTRVSDPRIAEALTIAVHRGTSQIIQGTFVGERSAWMHNDYLKLLLQLRTFGLTATEKQLGRVAGLEGGGVKGYSYAAGLMLGQMALALPMHAARVHLAAAGREDADEYVKQNMNPATMVRTLMNYSSMSGSVGDVLDLTTGLAGGWLDTEGKELIGARTGAAGGLVSRSVPALGSIEGILKAAGGSADLHKSIKQAPFSNLWFLQPAINITHEE